MVEEMLKHYLQQECDIDAGRIGSPVIFIDRFGEIGIDYVSDCIFNVNSNELLQYAIEWGKRNLV